MSLRKLLGSALLALVCAGSQATPIHFEIDYEVNYIQSALDPRLQVGDTYKGSFTVDSALLLLSGTNLSASLLDFTTSFEDVTWTMGLPHPLSEFAGFRGPTGLGASGPGFDVFNGQITNLRGGVYGRGDVPFIDFSFDPNFSGTDPTCVSGRYCGNTPNAFWSRNSLGSFGGSMTISAVPEPSVLALLALGLAVAGLAAQRPGRRLRYARGVRCYERSKKWKPS